MSDQNPPPVGFEGARDQRNALERLGDRIPGFRGFQNRELRRDVDKLLREHLATLVGRHKARLREIAADYADAGEIEELDRFDRVDRRLDGLAQSLRFADYGASGLFDPVKIDEAALTRVYDFDLGLLDDVEALGDLLAAIPQPGEPPRPALDELSAAVRAVEQTWSGREAVFAQAAAGGR